MAIKQIFKNYLFPVHLRELNKFWEMGAEGANKIFIYVRVNFVIVQQNIPRPNNEFY